MNLAVRTTVATIGLCAMVGGSLVGTTTAGAASSSAAASAATGPRLFEAGSRAPVPGKLSVAQKRALSRGYLVRDQAAYATAKAAAARRAAIAPRADATPPRAPAFDGAPLRSWQGVDDPAHSPTDSTGTVGPSRYVELVNSEVAFYDRTNDAPLSVGALDALAGEAGDLFDPQMIWDAGTNRFFYVMDNIVSSTDNRLEVGFSTTANPSSTADFCKYTVKTGAEFYDYPKLGDSSNLWMIGANVFDTTGTFVRSDAVGLTKPAAGTACPAGNSLTVSIVKNLLDANSSSAFTPVPANQTDADATGWIVSAGFAPANQLSVFPVTKNAANQMVVGAAKTVAVSSFNTPVNAVQKGSVNTLDSADGRLTNAVSAIDPSRAGGSTVGIWTQHTVFGGLGAQVRWYEINPVPATPALLQSGAAGSSTVFAFNGAIAPDRRVNGASAMFGSGMVLGFNTSSSTQFINIMAVSKRASHGQSGQETIVAGTEAEDDFSCAGGTCRSGDYGGASPDPASDPAKADGVVWQTNQFPGSDWHTWNFAGRPSSAPK